MTKIITIKSNEGQEESSPVARKWNHLIADLFRENKSNKAEIISKYLENDRTVLDEYIANDYKKLKEKNLSSRQSCKNDEAVYRDVFTTDFQIELINECKSHKDYLITILHLMQSKIPEERREYNQDIYYDILDYMIDKITEEQVTNYWED